jgi:hypothetical protein
MKITTRWINPRRVIFEATAEGFSAECLREDGVVKWYAHSHPTERIPQIGLASFRNYALFLKKAAEGAKQL